MDPIQKPALNAARLHSRLSKQAENSHKLFANTHPHAQDFFEKRGITPQGIRTHAAKLLTSGTLAASFLLASPAISHISPIQTFRHADLAYPEKLSRFAQEIRPLMPEKVTTMNESQAEAVSTIIRQYWGIETRANLQGEQLNTTYGFMGAEQHLPRYPGDTVENHDEYQDSGITPGRGAWGYFASSKEDLTPDLIQKEKYYVAVQTLYLPDWNTRTKYLKDWYKYRKVLVVNPTNGKTIVADIADAGPAAFTGKHFGGSPEVMAYLGLNKGMKKGAVVLLFVDDPDNSISLGPVEHNKDQGRAIADR